MRIRWKLLILMLVIALVPILAARTLAMRSLQFFEQRLIAQTRQELVTQAQDRLRLLVQGYIALLGSERQRLETILDFQVKEVEYVLATTPPGPDQVYLAGGAHNGNPPLPDRVPSARHSRVAGKDFFKPLEISYSTQVFQTPPGVDLKSLKTDVARLSALTKVYQRLHRQHPGALWHYTSLKNGLHSVYPGSTDIPCQVDARKQPWYFETPRGYDSPWSQPFVDAVTGRVVWAASKPVKRPNDETAGVTALVVPIRQMLESKWLAENMPPETKAYVSLMIKDAATGKGKLFSIAADDYSSLRRRSWRTPLDPEPLDSTDKVQLEAMRHDHEIGQSNIRRMPHLGRDSLWVYGPILYEPQGFSSYLVLIMPFEKILQPIQEAEGQLQDLFGNIRTMTGLVMTGAVVLAALLAFWFIRSMTRPIEELMAGSARLAQGDFEVKVDIKSSDELGRMGMIFNTVGPRLKEHYQMSQALELAREVQQNLLPRQDPVVPGLDVSGQSLYSQETGGDYYDYLLGTDAEISVVVGDVSGHGVQGALLMSTARAFLRQRAAMPGGLDRIVSDVNRQLSRDVEDTGSFMTMFICTVNRREKVIRWVSAGHDPALIFEMDTDSFAELGGRGLPLGVDEDWAYQEYRRDIAPRQIVLIGTDGIWEARDPEGRMFGKENLREVIRQNARRPAREISTAVVKAVVDFRRSLPQEDDVTLVVIKVVE
ncbi:MAG: SpoIIE family protein phosphatase [Pseudomonadota bacterium]